MTHPTTPKPRRLAKFKRDPDGYDAKYGRFTLTERDRGILDLIYRYRHVEMAHIEALTPGKYRELNRRAQGLFHHSYVSRHTTRQRSRVDLDLTGSQPMVYGLDTKGANELEAWRRRQALEQGEEFDSVKWRKSYSRTTEWFLEHGIMRSQFHAVLELALQGRGDLEFLEWDQGKDIEGEVKLSNGTILRVKPDAYFSIDDGETVRNYFVEVDRSSEELTSKNKQRHTIERKYRNYWWYLQSPAYLESHHDPKRVAVLFVTTGQKRLENMMATLAAFEAPNRAGRPGWFQFCLETDYSLAAPASVLEPIWRNVVAPGEKKPLVL